jgi:hypothetical protein
VRGRREPGFAQIDARPWEVKTVESVLDEAAARQLRELLRPSRA